MDRIEELPYSPVQEPRRRDPVRNVWRGKAEDVPGSDRLMTETAASFCARPQFVNGIGHHIYVNGFDLVRVEREAYDAGFNAGRLAALDSQP